MNRKIRVAAYARVSTDQEDQLHSLSAQIKYFTEYISEHEDWELVEVYYDEGITGTSVKRREGFNRMIADCENGKIDTILTKEVSRFARNTVDTLNYTRHLSLLKINVIFMSDNIDTNDKDGELRLTIMASLAQEESRKMSERIKWGMRRKMENGLVVGKKKVYGYVVKDSQLEIVPEEAKIVRRIFHEYLYEHKGSSTIAHELNDDKIPTASGNLWTATTIIFMLRNEKYVGDLTQWKYYSESYLTKRQLRNRGENPEIPLISCSNHHEPIITREVWDGVQAELAKRQKMPDQHKRYSGTYWFSGKIVCGICGKTFSIAGGKKGQRKKLRCRNRAVYGAEVMKAPNGELKGCDNKTVVADAIGYCIRYILQQVQHSHSEIEQDLLSEIESLQAQQQAPDIEKG